MKWRAVTGMALAVVASACQDSPAAPPATLSIELTAAQAAAIRSGIQAIGVSTPELAWLGDSATLVVKAGAVVDTATLDVSFGGGPYYAVSLQRSISHPSTPFSTFDAIYFNNPSNPTRFVIVSAYARGNVGPPDGVIANIATPTPVLVANVHLYAIEGQAVTHWRATAGSMILGNGLPGGACPAFTATSAVTCEMADLLIAAEVSATTRESGAAAGTPTLSIVDGFVRGIRLKFQTL